MICDKLTKGVCAMSESAQVKINLDLVPKSQHIRISGLFFAAMTEFFENPENEAEYQEWSRQRRERTGDTRQ